MFVEDRLSLQGQIIISDNNENVNDLWRDIELC